MSAATRSEPDTELSLWLKPTALPLAGGGPREAGRRVSEGYRDTVLDHVFLDAIGALRDAFEQALLERQAFEEGFKVDVLLGDVEWQTAYGLPGEGLPPRIVAEITLDWPTWAQTAYRSWYIGEPFDEPPRIDMDITVRIQRLAEPADPSVVLAALPTSSPQLGRERLERSAPMLTKLLTPEGPDDHAIEVHYEGTVELDEETLTDGSAVDRQLAALGGWVASTLVKLGDLSLQFHPPSKPGAADS